MGDQVEVVVHMNQQQLQLIKRLIQEHKFGSTREAVIRSVLTLFRRQHPELFKSHRKTKGIKRTKEG